MKKIFKVIPLFFINILICQDYHQFSENEIVFLYGDNVKLRELPDVNSKILKLLPIGTKLTIKKKTNKQYEYNKIKSPWYLVDYKGIEGYLIGGLISLKKDISSSNPDNFFVYNLSKEMNISSVNVRFINDSKLKSELKIELFGNGNFEILKFDNKGLENANDIIVIDNYSGACGIDGGKSYIICNSEDLIHMANTSEIGDGGIYHYESNFIFPSDEDGKEGFIIYYQENGEMIDETTEWYITTSQKRNLKWNGTKLIPDNYNKTK